MKMDVIGKQDLWSFTDNADVATVVECQNVRRWDGNEVASYFELAARIAELQFRNRDYVLLYRGQASDYKSDNLTALPPSIFRREKGSFNRDALPAKFESLRKCEEYLVSEFQREHTWIGSDEIERHRVLRWSILQHYEVCPTPLLDVTHSLRIAASFASNNNKTTEAFVYVIGVPNLSGAISASAEAGLQILRLASFCPPTAMRPHIQEGYLVGEYPDIADPKQKGNYSISEIDLGRRLVAKFKFNPTTFWTISGQFQKIGPKSLFPTLKQDPFLRVASKIKAMLQEST
jgi:hypothetical protein